MAVLDIEDAQWVEAGMAGEVWLGEVALAEVEVTIAGTEGASSCLRAPASSMWRGAAGERSPAEG